FDVRPIAAPMKGFMTDDVLQGLRDHHALHWMEVVGHECALMVHHRAWHFAGGISQVPCETIHPRIHVARGARHLPKRGGAAGIIEMAAARRHGDGRGSKERDGASDCMAAGINDAEARRKGVEYGEPLP